MLLVVAVLTAIARCHRIRFGTTDPRFFLFVIEIDISAVSSLNFVALLSISPSLG